jgi:hypothetical protein
VVVVVVVVVFVVEVEEVEAFVEDVVEGAKVQQRNSATSTNRLIASAKGTIKCANIIIATFGIAPITKIT